MQAVVAGYINPRHKAREAVKKLAWCSWWESR